MVERKGDIPDLPFPEDRHEANTVRADQLAEGQTIAAPYTGTPETITDLWIGNGYVDVKTDKTGPKSMYQWPYDEPITVLPDADTNGATR